MASEKLVLPRTRQVLLTYRRGPFKTPKDGMPANPVQGPWYLMVIGPSVARGQAHPPMPLRWQQRSAEAKRIDAYNQQQKALLMRSPEKPKHNPAYRQSLRIEQRNDAAHTTPPKSAPAKQ